MPRQVTYILSHLHKSLAFEWIAECLNPNKFNLSFILLNPGDSAIEQYLRERRIPVRRITYRGKKDLPKAILAIYRQLKQDQTDIVHCHLFDACIAGLTAAKLAGVKKRIYTRHHSTLHHQYFPRAVAYDRFINSLATDVIAISENVQNVLIARENVSPSHIHLIHHGFRLEEFSSVRADRVHHLRAKYQVTGRFPVIGVISRYLELKGIQYVIPAFKKVLAQYPDAHLLLANALGDYASAIRSQLTELPKENYTEISFEPDIDALYRLFHVFVHVPVNAEIEAFGQTYVEALAAGIPSVFTLSGVAPEFVRHQKNAWVVPFRNSDAIADGILFLLQNQKLASDITRNGFTDVTDRFSLHKMIDSLENLYVT